MKGKNKRKMEKKKREDEVEEMLEAVQDEILLNLSHSHIIGAKKDNNIADTQDLHLDLDLERRFQALKMKTKSASQQDLSARFDALKTKSSSSSSSVGPTVTTSNSNYYKGEEEESEEDEEAQVQKLIQWAKDAARLDPSPPSDDDSDI